MRVRMLKTHEQTTSHPEHGSLTLLFGAGSTQHFDDTTAKALVDSKIAEVHPEDSLRVRMTRTLTENELADRINAARARAGVTTRYVPTPGSEAHRYRKGELVHFPEEAAQALLDTAGDGGPAAEPDPDPDYDPITASRNEATETAAARKHEQLDADARRETMKAKVAGVTRPSNSKSAGSGTPTKPSPAPSAPATPVSTSPTSPAASSSSES